MFIYDDVKNYFILTFCLTGMFEMAKKSILGCWMNNSKVAFQIGSSKHGKARRAAVGSKSVLAIILE